MTFNLQMYLIQLSFGISKYSMLGICCNTNIKLQDALPETEYQRLVPDPVDRRVASWINLFTSRRYVPFTCVPFQAVLSQYSTRQAVQVM